MAEPKVDYYTELIQIVVYLADVKDMNDESNRPSDEMLEKMKNALNKELDELLKGRLDND
ncbi:MAG: hypothetical protein IKP68_00640 [Clostridia bacterium]|nr:hypothetical protein [Clostridia bacterium]